MTRHIRSIGELEEALAEQREFLRQSSAAYDAGSSAEAKRLATAVYVMMHDGAGRTRSLLGQLGLRNSMKFLSTAHKVPPETVPKTALAFMSFRSLDEQVQFFPRFYNPKLRDEGRFLAASEWWDEPVYQALGKPLPQNIWGEGRTISRKNLVFHLRNQDGGAHVDEELRDEAYVDLALKAGTGMEIKRMDGTYAPVPFPHLATMRQIAWEIEQSMIPISGGPSIPPPLVWNLGPDPRVDEAGANDDSVQTGATISVENAIARQEALLDAARRNSSPTSRPLRWTAKK